MSAFRSVRWLVAALLLPTVAARAQQFNSLAINRPSDLSPSAQLGLVGGRTTQFGYAVQPLSRPSLAYQSDRGYYGYPVSPRFGAGGGAGGGASPILGRYNSGVTLGGRGTDYGLARGGGLGVDLRERQGPRPMPTPGYISNPMRLDATDFADATRFDSPIMGWKFEHIFVTDQPYCVEPESRSTFKTIFGLSQTVVAPHGDSSRDPSEGLGALVAEDSDVKTADVLRRGIESFKLAMNDATEDRYGHLMRAQLLLNMAVDLDEKTAVAPLLLAHIAFERSHMDSAAQFLGLAIRRDPTIVASVDTVRSYYGDPKVLNRQAQSIIRQKESIPTARLQSVQAYCAWLLSDQPRLEDFLKQLDTLNHGPRGEDVGKSIWYALTAAQRESATK